MDAMETVRKEFREPPKAFSPVPVWWWSGDKLDKERIRWQMERFAAGGVYNLMTLNLAPTGPLYGSDPDDPPFLSEAWWDMYDYACQTADELGLRLWFYDQIGFASANLQGTLIQEDPSFAGASLAAAAVEGEGTLEIACPKGGEPLQAFATPLDADGEPAGPATPVDFTGDKAVVHGEGRRRLRLIYVVRRGFDYLSKKACAKLLERVHGQFERRLGKWFGKVIVGSFQDELPALPTWSPRFAEAFQTRKGYDLLPELVRLWEGDDERSMQVRIDYQQVRAELAEEAFFRPFFEWHERRGLICGFDQQAPARGGSAVGGVRHYGDYLRTHRWYGAPGSDHSGDGKIHSSISHQYGRPRVWIESFHSSGWGGTIEETFDWLLPWFQAGANLYNPHAAYYSTRGGWYEWAPPSTCWRQPYWKHYKLFADAVSRLSYLLTRGRHVCDVAVLFPAMTAQASAKMGESIRKSEPASDIFLELIGSMHWSRPQVGALDADRRDFEVLNDEILERAEVKDGRLHSGGEAYAALVLPGCRVISDKSAEVLEAFVKDGGMLVAIGTPPEWIHGTDGCRRDGRIARLFEEGKATLVAGVEEVAGALERVARRVDAPVPTLHRRMGAWDILYVPAAFPKATDIEGGVLRNWWRSAYTFDADDYQRSMRVALSDVGDRVELWDPKTGESRALSVTRRDGRAEVEIPFDTGPAAVLVWKRPEGGEGEASGAGGADADGSRRETRVVAVLGPVWQAEVAPTMDNRHGDFDKPDYEGSPKVATWFFDHRVEGAGEDGLARGWHKGAPTQTWERVKATYGTYALWTGPVAADALREPGEAGEATWKKAVYSRSRGMESDPLYVDTLGPKAHVPEEFLYFGEMEAGQGVHVRTGLWADADKALHLAVGAAAAKRLWVNGVAVSIDDEGYVSLAPVSLKAGLNQLDLHLIALENGPLRAYWAVVRRPDRFTRPEWIQVPGPAVRDDAIAFFKAIELPFEPTQATVQVAATAPCRLLINGEEAGRQGSFESYGVTTRVQPYAVATFKAGLNEITVEAQDLNKPVGVLVDAVIEGPSGERLTLFTGADWQCRRAQSEAMPVQLRKKQWLDPAWCHLWRRPHPLPKSDWIEDRSADGTVDDAAFDASLGRRRVEWFRWTLPPGAKTLEASIAGKASLWVDGQEVAFVNGQATLPDPGALGRRAVMRVVPERGRTEGAVFDGPVTYAMGPGTIREGDWQDEGLESYSGGLRYATTVALEDAPEGRVALDLGRVRGSAEVWVNGQWAGARVWSPYRFDVQELLRPGENKIEVVIYNTLAPYLRAASPTHYIFPGQTVSGMFGPVRLVASTSV